MPSPAESWPLIAKPEGKHEGSRALAAGHAHQISRILISAEQAIESP